MSHPPIIPASIMKSKEWGQFFALHDHLKKAIIRPKDKIELGELAEHNILLGDLFLNIYNAHKHKAPCDDLTDPPEEQYHIKCPIHLSRVSYTIRAPEDQPASGMMNALADVANQVLDNTDPGERESFFSDPLSWIEDKLGSLGEDIVNYVKEKTDGILQGVGDWLKSKVEDVLGFELPDLSLEGLWESAKGWLGDKAGDLLMKGLETVVGSVLPVGALSAALDVGKALLAGDPGAALAPLAEAAVSLAPPPVGAAAAAAIGTARTMGLL